jgi:transcriptional regulator with XRE-family HTH domain
MTFGEFIKSKRLAKKITLRKFTEAVEIEPAEYSALERGIKSPLDHIDRFITICMALDLNPDEYKEMRELAYNWVKPDIKTKEYKIVCQKCGKSEFEFVWTDMTEQFYAWRMMTWANYLAHANIECINCGNVGEFGDTDNTNIAMTYDKTENKDE